MKNMRIDGIFFRDGEFMEKLKKVYGKDINVFFTKDENEERYMSVENIQFSTDIALVSMLIQNPKLTLVTPIWKDKDDDFPKKIIGFMEISLTRFTKKLVRTVRVIPTEPEKK